MKKNYLIFLLLAFLTVYVHGQAPDAFRYQAMVADSEGNAMKDADVTLRFSIKEGSATGTKVYTETHSARTNQSGLVALSIGKGNPVEGNFISIPWITGNYFVEVEIDRGDGFVPAGTQQLLSVPYAKYADNAGSLQVTSSNGKKWNVTVDDNGTVSVNEMNE
jgi:hypothetical protein